MKDTKEDKDVEKKEDKPRKKIVVEEVVSPVESIPETNADTMEPVHAPVHASKPEESKTPLATQMDEPPTNSKLPMFLWIIFPGFLILAAVVGGIYVYQRGVNSEQSKIEVSPSPTALVVQTPTPSPIATPNKAELSKYSVSILNGSGIPGEATKVKNLLTEAGFKVSTVGNAKTYDYEETVIQAKKDVDLAILAELKSIIQKSYSLKDAVEELPSSQASQIVVTVGNKKP